MLYVHVKSNYYHVYFFILISQFRIFSHPYAPSAGDGPEFPARSARTRIAEVTAVMSSVPLNRDNARSQLTLEICIIKKKS